jgi:hypothetical protein
MYEIVFIRLNCRQTSLKAKSPLRRPKHRWKDNIKMNLIELGLGWRIGSSGPEPVAGSCGHRSYIKAGEFFS